MSAPTPPTTARVEATDVVPDYNLLGQTEVAFDPGLSLTYVTQVVEALTPVLDRVVNNQAGDRYLRVRHVVVGHPHHPWGVIEPRNDVATCMITIDVPLGAMR